MSKTHRKNSKTFVIGTILVLAVSFYLIKNSGRDHQKYQTFKSENPAFNFTFEYPETWKIRETEGKTDPYAMVHATGPRDNQKEFSVGFFITVKDIENQTSDRLLADHLKSVERFKNFKIVEQKKNRINGETNPFAIYQYILMLPFQKIGAQAELVKTETGFVVQGEKSYHLNFVGTEKQFEKYKPVFQKVLTTFRFN